MCAWHGSSGSHAGVDHEREEAELGKAQVTLGGGQSLAPHLLCHVCASEVRVIDHAAVDGSDQLVEAVPPGWCEGDAPGLDLAEPDP